MIEKTLVSKRKSVKTPSMFLSLKAGAEIFGVHINTMYRLVHTQQIPSIRIGRKWLLRRVDIEKFEGTAFNGQMDQGRNYEPKTNQHNPTESGGHYGRVDFRGGQQNVLA